jgi:hypothetical protein
MPQFVKTYGAGGGVRTHELLRERITYRDPIVCYDLKSAAFDRAWLLPLCSVRQAKSTFPEELTAVFSCGMPTLQLFGVGLAHCKKWWAAPDLNQRPSIPISMELDWILGVSETS